ncbi:unnamed protein product [Amoebophrya sp. A120]|nr:unnamed protein product [Amoebophrya sp. A120]|eukprot:GSA120T00008318001.1
MPPPNATKGGGKSPTGVGGQEPSSGTPTTSTTSAPIVGGMACRFPQSRTTAEFWENLITGKNMITQDDEHWESGFHNQLPLGKGSVQKQEYFDTFFFNMSGAQAEKTDPQLRFLLELSYEALCDSNLDIQKLKGSNCGVFVGSCFSDCHKAWLHDVPAITGYENTGCAQSMYANRLSFFYDFHGPSFNVDTACSSSLVAFSQACRALEAGECDVCLVGGSSITLHAGVSVAFNRLHMLSPDSACMSFSKNGNGYARSEGVAMLVLYREDKVGQYCRNPLCKNPTPNSYFKVLGFGINSDGFTKKGITFPNGEAQYDLYRQVCKQANVDPSEIFYIEAHGTGTAAGDGQELEALRRAYLEPRKKINSAENSNKKANLDSCTTSTSTSVQQPLLLGSVKSNMGHAEGASAMAGLIKLCLSWSQKQIPANLHYTYEDRNKGCEQMLGDLTKCQVVEKNYPIEEPNEKKVAISSFGFGGTNAHAVLSGQVNADNMTSEDSKMNKVTNRALSEKICEEEKWRLITPIYGRTADGVHAALEALQEKNIAFDHLVGPPSVHDHLKEFPAMGYKTLGGDIVTSDEPQPYVVGRAESGEESSPLQEEQKNDQKRRPLWLLFSGNGGMWPLMGKDLYENSKIYRETFDKCCEHLHKEHNYDKLKQFLTEPDVTKYTAVEGVCGLAAVQISLIEVLRRAGLQWDGMFGHSAGETAMGYADGCLTLEETMSVAYYRSLCGADSVDKENPGGMYACGVSREKMEELLQAYHCTRLTQVGCDNDPSMVTLSGSEREMKPITVELTAKKILCRKVPTFGVAFHSAMLEPGLAKLKEQLEKVIDNAPGKPKEQRRRSSKWVSTCYDDDVIRKDPNHPGNFVSAEYHYYNFRNTVEFYRAVKSRVPANAVVVEVGPSGLFRSSIKKIAAVEKRPMHYFSLMSRDKNSLHTFQNAFGQLMFQGLVKELTVDFAKPEKQLLPKDIPVIASDLKLKQVFTMWDHGTIYPIPGISDMVNKTGAVGEQEMGNLSGEDWKNIHIVEFDFSTERDSFIMDHVIDNTVLMPACGYIFAAWESFANVLRKRGLIQELNEARDVKLVDFKIHQGIRLDESNVQMKLTVRFSPASGDGAANVNGEEYKIFYGEEHIVTGRIKLEKSTTSGGPAAAPPNTTVVAPLGGSPNENMNNVPDSDTFGHALGAVTANEFYCRIARNGYNYENAFQLVENVGIDDSWAWVRFDHAVELVQSAVQAATADVAKDQTGASNVAEKGQLGDSSSKQKLELQDDIVFNRYWISFLDNLLQVSLLKNLNDSATLRVPTSIREICIRGSQFGNFLRKMREGTVGMRHIESTDSVQSRASSLENKEPGVMMDKERKLFLVEAQAQSGTQLVKILPYMNQVASDIADVTGLATSIMARSTKAKEKRVLHVARKKIFDLKNAVNVRKDATAISLLLSYLKEQFVSGNFTVVDFLPVSMQELTQKVMETSNVEKFSVLFDKTLDETKKQEYQQKSDGVCEEVKENEKFDVALVHDESVLPEQITKVDSLLATEESKAEEFQPPFVIVKSDTTGKMLQGQLPVANLFSKVIRVNALETGNEFILYKKTPAKPALSARTSGTSNNHAELQGTSNASATAHQLNPALLQSQVLQFSGYDGLEVSKEQVKEYEQLFLRLSDDCFTKDNIRKLAQFLQEVNDSEKYPKLQKLFLLAGANGFPGFLRCVQKEPSFSKIRGVHLVSNSSANISVGYSNEASERIANALPQISQLDARLIRLDVKTKQLSVELSFYEEEQPKYPAPFGEFLTFPQPGNLEAFAWKAHPHFSVLSLGDEVENPREFGTMLLPQIVTKNSSGVGTTSLLLDETEASLPPNGTGANTGTTLLQIEVAADKYTCLSSRAAETLPQKSTSKGTTTSENERSTSGLFSNLFGGGSSNNLQALKKDNGTPGGNKVAGSTIAKNYSPSSDGKIQQDGDFLSDTDANLFTEAALSRKLQTEYLKQVTANATKDLQQFNRLNNTNGNNKTGTSSKKRQLRSVDVSFAALNFRDIMLAYNKIDKDAIVGHSKMGDGFGLEFAGYYTPSDSLSGFAEQAYHGSDMFSGHHHHLSGNENENKIKVIGLTYNSLATKVTVPANLLWELKPNQELRHYATVPCVYATCYYSLLVRGQFTPETSVLIHAGAGGVGQAALYICLKRTSDPSLIFTTCSTKKRQYLLEKFGHLGLQEKNIGNTRDTSFEQLVMKNTNGRGVDICLNSLSDEKLMASVRCVAAFGRFCEIGKYDLMQNTGLGMHCLLKNVSIMGIDLDQILNQPREWATVHRLVQEGILSGEVEPLDVGGCFSMRQITEAFRFMGAGTHVGKVLLQFDNTSTKGDDVGSGSASTTAGDMTSRSESRESDAAGTIMANKAAAGTMGFNPPGRTNIAGASNSTSSTVEQSPASSLSNNGGKWSVLTDAHSEHLVADTPNFTPKNPNRDGYLIIGGLGGFGLELAEFLAMKGVKHIVLSSRGTIRNGLQAKYLTKICKVYGCHISVTNVNFADKAKCEKFLNQNKHIAGFFNLGMVLADGLFHKMEGNQWATPILAKGIITENFSEVAQKLNLEFDHFVCFSSVSAGLGNAGQTNYGFANAELDHLIRMRNQNGLSGLSLQWGAIGDVGVLSRANSKKTGLVDAVLPQEIQSCLQELEKLLASNSTGVHTVYLTPKRVKDDSTSNDSSVPLEQKVREIVGAKATVKDTATLEMLGADSLQSMEIQSLIKMRTGEKIAMDKLSKMTLKQIRELEG